MVKRNANSDWTEQIGPWFGAPDGGMVSADFIDGGWVVLGPTGKLYHQDGFNWDVDQIDDPTFQLRDIVHQEAPQGGGTTSGEVCLFCEDFEDFEDGDWLGWGDGGGGYAVSIVPPQTLPGGNIPQSEYALSLTGPWRDGQSFTGIFRDLANITPFSASVSLGITHDLTGAHLTLSGVAGTMADIELGWEGSGRLLVNGNYLVNFNVGDWLNIELANIDWSQRTFDVLLNSSMVGNEIPFQDPTTSLEQIDFYNTIDGQSWLDEIRLLE